MIQVSMNKWIDPGMVAKVEVDWNIREEKQQHYIHVTMRDAENFSLFPNEDLHEATHAYACALVEAIKDRKDITEYIGISK